MARSLLTGALVGAFVAGTPLFAQAVPTRAIGNPAATQAVGFTVRLPLRNAAALDQLIALQSDRRSPLYHHFLSVAQFRAAYAPTAQTVARAAAALQARGLTVTGHTTQSLRVAGPAAAVERAFNTKLGAVVNASGALRIANSVPLVVPAELQALGAAVIGLKAQSRMHVDSRQIPLNRYGTNGPYWFDDLKQAYAYPSDRVLDGRGSTIGILMSSDVLDSDTTAELAHEKYSAVSGKTALPLIRRPVFGGAPFTGVTNGASDEASIDVQTSLGSAPGAQIVLYNIPDLSDEAVNAGLTEIVEFNEVDVVNMSFGGCELQYTPAYNHGIDYRGVLAAQDDLFKQGNSQGITFVASSGDSAGLQCPTPGYFFGEPNARFVAGLETPAADPNVTAVGGTNLETTYPSATSKLPVLRSTYVSENAYADAELPYDPYSIGQNVRGGYWGSGSGTSQVFAKPWYQQLIATGSASGRVVPDISMQMGGCPGGISLPTCGSNGESASVYTIGGSRYGFIGTSLSSPEFAGVLALGIQASKSRLGNVNGYIYSLAAANDALPANFPNPFLHQGIAGYNGIVHVAAGTRGYNPIVGVGTPFVRNALGLAFPLAGDPQTFTNP